MKRTENNVAEPGSLEYSLVRVNLETLRITEFDEKFTEMTGYDSGDIAAGLIVSDLISDFSSFDESEIIGKVRRRRLATKRYKIRCKDESISLVNCSFFADENDYHTVKIIVTDMNENEREIVWAQISRQIMCAVNIYDGISKSLEFIGRHLGPDRVTFVEFDQELVKITRSLQWSADGIKKTQSLIYDIKLADVKSLGYTGSYVIYGDNESYPTELAGLFSQFGVSSLIGYAVRDKESIYGYLFIASIEKRAWSVGQYEVLQTMADVIMSGLRKERTEEMLWLSRENDRKILSCIPAAVVVIDKETHDILYKNNAARLCFPDMKLGEKCYRCLCGRDIQCVNCPADGNIAEYSINNGKYNVSASEMQWENSRRARVLQLVPVKAPSSETIEKKYAFVYSKSCDIYYEMDLLRGSCKTTVINEKLAYPLGEISGGITEEFNNFVEQFVDEKTAADLRERVFRHTLKNQRAESSEVEIKSPGGAKLWFLFRATQITDEGNSLLIITAKNINDKKQILEMDYLHRDNVNRSTIKVYPFVVMVDITTGEYVILQNESGHLNVADSGSYDNYHIYFNNLIHSDEQVTYDKMMCLSNLRKRFEGHGNELTFTGRCFEENDGEYHWLSMLAARASHDEEGHIKIVIVGRYVDEERYRELSMREELERSETANRSRNAFLSRMSHDMRTPLNSIINMTELARKNISIPALAEECLDKSQLSSRYLLSLVNNVLDLSRYENGKIVINRDIINVEQFLDDINEMIEPEITFRKQHFKIHRKNIANESVYGDETRLKQIILNLITNAIKFTPEGGHIDFSVNETSCSEKSVFTVFRVSDNGIGMSKDFQKRLFIPFEQEHAGNRSYGGSGLGLSICRALVDAMGGKITVYSTEGSGTEFEVRLEFERCEPIAEAEEAVVVPLNSVCRHVLLVEDDKINAEIAEMLLSAENVQSEIAFNGKMAVEKFEASEAGYYDAILMDIQMPVMDGLEATKIIRAMKRADAQKIPIIAMTANVYIKDIEEAKAYGMTYHIQKPVNPKLLYEALQKCCEKH